MGGVGLNVFPYVPGHILEVSPSQLDAITGPAWIAGTPEQVRRLNSRQAAAVPVLSFGEDDEWRLIRIEN
jgi:hypothetical protein